MKFEIRPGLICFLDDKPGNNAAMNGPLGSLAPRGDASLLDDATHTYLWAFDAHEPLFNGQQYVFSTDDRRVAGVVKHGKILLADAPATEEPPLTAAPPPPKPRKAPARPKGKP